MKMTLVLADEPELSPTPSITLASAQGALDNLAQFFENSTEFDHEILISLRNLTKKLEYIKNLTLVQKKIDFTI